MKGRGYLCHLLACEMSQNSDWQNKKILMVKYMDMFCLRVKHILSVDGFPIQFSAIPLESVKMKTEPDIRQISHHQQTAKWQICVILDLILEDSSLPAD